MEAQTGLHKFLAFMFVFLEATMAFLNILEDPVILEALPSDDSITTFDLLLNLIYEFWTIEKLAGPRELTGLIADVYLLEV